MKNALKTAVLLAALGGLFMGIGVLLGGSTGLIIGLAFGLMVVGGSYWFSDRLAIKAARAVPATREQYPDLYEIVERLAAEADIPTPRIYVSPEMQPNAFATGRGPKHAAVAVTQGILQVLDRDELAGVLAHELSHVKNRDILIGSVAAAIAMAITSVVHLAYFGAIFGGGDDDDDGGGVVGAILAMILAPIAAGLIQMAISRLREFQADASGAELLHDGEPLARALQKIEAYAKQVPMNVNPAQASAYIVNPLTGRKVEFANLFSSHPPTAERVAAAAHPDLTLTPRRALVVLTVSALALAFVGPARAADGTPEEWDRRVAEYVRFVERERGLEFEHPVRVRFLGDAAFRKAAGAWYDDTTDEDQDRADQESADLLALGLVTEDFDALAATESSDSAGTLGWYDDEREVMMVRGTDVADTEVKLTIVHELTHVLQDQHFDFGDLYAGARTSGEYAGIGGLVEGDATLVEQAYLFSLPKSVRQAYWKQYEVAAGDVVAPEEGAGAAWPFVYDLWSAFDYDLAPTALEVAIAAHGRDRVDDLFRTPPRSEEAFVDPVALEEGDEPRRVRLPRFGPGEEPRGDADDFGAFSLYLVLGSRVPWQLALQAVEGWGGDRYRSYVRAVDGIERECVRLAVVGDTDADTAELEGALATWASAMPDGAARVERAGARVVLSACATGVAPAAGNDAMQTAYDRLWERNDGMWYFTDPSLPPGEYTRCVADALVADRTAQPLLARDQELRRKDRRILEDRVDQVTRECA